MLRIVFFGTPDFAVPTLRALLESDHRVVGVVSQPDRPRGRGQHLQHTPVKAVAISAGVPVLQPARLKDESTLDQVRALDADLGVVVAYGRILPEALLAVPRLGLVNVHASLLPAWRGAAPIHRAVIAGDRETGITIMRVVKELDAGAMLARATLAIGPDETSAALEARLAPLGAALLVETLRRIEAGTVVEEPQDPARATHAPRLTREESPIDWARPAAELHNRVRGLQPWPTAVCAIDGRRLSVLAARPEPWPASTAPAEPGTVLDARGDRVVVACGEGTALALLAVQPEGRRVMRVRDYLAGHRLVAGARFTTPTA
jgi:methionyl-tRNA formyltransferase